MSNDLPPVPTTVSELSAGLKRLRTRGLRQLEKEQHRLLMLNLPGRYGYSYSCVISKSTLARYEKGQLPPLTTSRHLDQLYAGKGWIDLGIRSLWKPSWDPWSTVDGEFPSSIHSFAWPARYSGNVWMKVVPAVTRTEFEHVLDLSWGPWRQKIVVELPASGLTFVTGKAEDADGSAVTMNVASNSDCYVLFGAGANLGGEAVRDIRFDWTRPDSS